MVTARASGYSSSSSVVCQLCGADGHSASHCQDQLRSNNSTGSGSPHRRTVIGASTNTTLTIGVRLAYLPPLVVKPKWCQLHNTPHHNNAECRGQTAGQLAQAAGQQAGSRAPARSSPRHHSHHQDHSGRRQKNSGGRAAGCVCCATCGPPLWCSCGCDCGCVFGACAGSRSPCCGRWLWRIWLLLHQHGS